MKILIAEDDIDFRAVLEATLTSWGHEVISVGDGLEALAHLRQEAGPPLALLDWFMPGFNGIEVCRELRRGGAAPYVYVILVTGRAARQDLLEGLEAGADDYLVKPVDVEEMRARLATALRIVTTQQRLLAEQEALRRQATHDPLTGLWNRAVILEILEREVSRSRREGGALGVLMADLDHFKAINDTYGHPAGDAVLREAAQCMLAAYRPYDTIGRYGGEEFLIVLPGCDVPTLVDLGERLRRSIADRSVSLPGGGAVWVTLSLGAAASDAARPLEAAALVQAADTALYRAKQAGRNRVELRGDSGVGTDDDANEPPVPPAEDLGPWQSFVTAAEAMAAVETVAAAMIRAGHSHRDVFGMRLALEEAVVNAAVHGNRNDPSKRVRLRWRVDATRALSEVEDDGAGFDPRSLPDPLAPENLERPHGRGVLLMRAYMSWVRYNARGNRVSLCREAHVRAVKSLLVVEDDEDMREALRLTLQSAGYDVQSAENGQDALGQLREGPPPDLILLDLMLPVMSGWEFRDHQRRDPTLATIPVVVVSAAGDLRQSAAGLGAAAYLQKPVPTDELLAVVRQHC
jgi:diguanylate cyclase (GGDEF)-like protein